MFTTSCLSCSQDSSKRLQKQGHSKRLQREKYLRLMDVGKSALNHVQGFNARVGDVPECDVGVKFARRGGVHICA
jgi:hypothetical protein